MECNKDEALRAKRIAESKMGSGDFEGALKFAMKAKKLFPDIQNIVQILTVCEVHCAARKKPSASEMDWYGVLQTDRLANEVTIKKQYRKLALLLHPDKNKCAGAEAAFKLIGEANRTLSDQTKRSRYDMSSGVHMGTAAPKPPPYPSTASSFGMKFDGNARNYQHNFFKHSNSSHPWDEHVTFWTSCEHCHTRYQYYKIALNATMHCQQCSKSFKARDMGWQGEPPLYTGTSFKYHKEAPQHMPPKAASERNGEKPFGAGQEDKFGPNHASMEKCTAGGMKAAVGTSKPAASKAKKSQTSTNVGSKRARQTSSDLRDDNKAGKSNVVKDTNVQQNGVDTSGLNGVHHRRSSRKKQQVSYTETAEDGNVKISSKRRRQHELFNTAEAEGAEVPASGGLFNSYNSTSFTASVGGQNGEVRSKACGPSEEALLRSKTKIEQSRVQRKEESKSDVDDRKSNADHRSQLNSNSPPYAQIICPDPEFSDFEKDKAEDCFAAGQFWAIYDNSDSMPRFYAIVRKVFSPFKLQITWLEPDQSEIDWHDAGLPVACGKFELGNSQRTTDCAMFSHQIHCIKGSVRGSYLLYPKKGETWAIFKDWDVGWSSNPEKHKEHQFEYVEILSDFDENAGIKVAYLHKVKGFVSLFQQSTQNRISLFCFAPNELYRFSHRIPSYKMTGDEREGVPRGSFELDPAGLPSNLFEVGDPGDVKEDGMSNNGVNGSDHGSSKCKVKQVTSNESILKAKLHESNDAERVSSILRRSPRSNRKSMDSDQVSTSQHMVREDDGDIGHRDNGQPEGAAASAAFQATEKVRTPQKYEKNINERETLNIRRSPRDVSKKNAIDAGKCSTSKVTDDHSNATKNVEDNSFSQSVGTDRMCLKKDYKVVGASTGHFKEEKSEERFRCDQIWALYDDRDKVPKIYAQIKKIEYTPNFRLHMSILEPCSPPKGCNRPLSCGSFKVQSAKSQILSLSAISHQLRVEPTSNNRYEIYPRKGEIWAFYKDQNCDLTSTNQGSNGYHIVEVLSDGDKSIQVAILICISSFPPLYKAPRILRSKTGMIEITREDVCRFSHQIPAFQHSGEGNAHLRGCWVLDPSSIPGFVIQID